MAKSKRVSKSKKKTAVYKRKTMKSSKKTGNFLVRRVDAFLTVLKKEQKKCLRRKDSKNKKLLCFFRVLGDKYFWQTVVFVLAVALISFFMISSSRNNAGINDFFNRNLQTSLIDTLKEEIKKLTGRINDIEKCTKDKFWKENTEDICSYWLYEQENDNCKKHGIATKRIAIGTKTCCNPLDNSIHFDGDNKNVTACPGADMTPEKKTMFNSSLVVARNSCNVEYCQFYPAEGFHIKVNDDGTFAKNSDGGFIVEKDCKTSREVGPCNKDCGGGEQVAITKLKDCRTVETLELCNIQPCFTEVN